MFMSAAPRLLAPPALISITGGGGKTTLMYRLAAFMEENYPGRRTLLSTTTMIAAETESAKPILGPPSLCELKKAFDVKSVLMVGKCIEKGKLKGVEPAYLNKVLESGTADCIINEADGAKRLPFKSYEPHEPVIPACTTCQIIVVGAEILLSPPSEKNIFRYRLFKERWAHEKDKPLPLALLAQILCSRGEYLKNSVAKSRKVLVINKCDLLEKSTIPYIAEKLSAAFHGYDYLAFASLKKSELPVFAELPKTAGKNTA